MPKRSKSKRSRSPRVLPIPVRGRLSRFGYFDVKDTPDKLRHRALKRAIKAYGHVPTIRHLVLIANYTRNSDPSAYAIFKSDQEWISHQYVKVKSKSRKSKSKKQKSKSKTARKR